MRLDLDEVCAEWRNRLPLSPAGYAEEIDSSWRETGGRKRSALAQARLAYVFTHAGLRGDVACALAGVEAMGRLRRFFWDPESRGWMHTLTEAGAVVDSSIDTYDQAFGLLALAWHYRATGDPDAKTIAHLAVQGLREAAGATPGGEGYPEQRAAGDPRNQLPSKYRRQNPHMHLLEAFLAWYSVDPSVYWLDLASEVVRLFRARFLDTETGTLREYFDQRWQPADDPAGRIREPGHNFEWVWLLRRYFEASEDGSVYADARNLYRFAHDRGVDDDGVAFDVVAADGQILTDTKLLWPQTEMLKAHLAWFEWTNDESARERARQTLSKIENYFMIPGSALWHNQLDRERNPLPVPTLSRVLYHLFVALAEAERLL